jgi:opacity protein-like surface antigen
VYGIEADISGHSNAGSQSFMHVDSYEFGVLESKLDVFASLRLRFGYAFGSLMPYVTGGLALAHTTNTYNVQTKSIFFERKKWDWGWVAGAGFEYMMGSHLTVRAEALYARLDGGTISDSGGYFDPSVLMNVQNHSVALARVGAAYKF